MRRLRILAGAVLGAGLLATSGPAQGPARITPGLWETVVDVTDLQIQGSNMPPQMLKNMKPPRTTVRRCVTPAEAANPRAQMLAANDGKCDVRRMQMAGGKLSVAMTCADPQGGGKADIAASGTYTATSYRMTGTVKASGSRGMTMNIKSSTTGRRVGACKA